ncbi:cardiolipin synthase [Solibacillus kalamii]|uniref:Cardiolipin synthase n=2 Tax=Solibacillus kalamii TaxID=1748298 RepID=A0ABX3ZIQ8_9BACL|nr:cardiolipin synthase [Solibacillus kalamii]
MNFMTVTGILTVTLFALNIVFALVLIFISRKSASSTWAWLFVLFFLPIFGFILYLLIGRNLQKKHFVRWHAVQQEETLEIFQEQKNALEDGTYEFPNAITKKHEALIKMNVDYNHSLLSSKNDVKIMSEGKEKFRSVIEDIENAKQTIHIQYYIYKMDDVGKSIFNALVKKAKEGIEVQMMYDDLGSRTLRKKDLKKLTDAGGQVEAYFSSYFKLFNPRINFRNHRKLIIIDGRIGYIGGFNVGNEYACLDDEIGYWRDTHLRIEGNSVYNMQAHFLFDWYQAKKEELTEIEQRYFPSFTVDSDTPVQIVSSGPDTDFESIKNSYIRMILSAKKYVYIQSPYFVPDEPFMHAVQIAASSGVDVRIMTPEVTDHAFVYGANSAYSGDLLEVGGRVYRYKKGFLHAKMIVIDDEVATIGTANIDVRSFSLNFEINAILYDADLAIQCRKLFEADIEESFELTKEQYDERKTWTKVRESVSRLLSPIL